MLIKVEKRMAFAFPVLRIDKLEGVMFIFSARSPRDILRLAIITSKLTIIGIFTLIYGTLQNVNSHCKLLFFLKGDPTAPYLCDKECEKTKKKV